MRSMVKAYIWWMRRIDLSPEDNYRAHTCSSRNCIFFILYISRQSIAVQDTLFQKGELIFEILTLISLCTLKYLIKYAFYHISVDLDVRIREGDLGTQSAFVIRSVNNKLCPGSEIINNSINL